MIGAPSQMPETFGKQHSGAAAIACVLSAIAHIGLFVWLSRAKLEFRVMPAPPEDTEWSEPVKVFDVKRSRKPGKPRRPRPGETTDPSKNWRQATDLLGIPPEESSTAVPPADEEWLAAGQGKVKSPKAPAKAKEWQPRQEIMIIEKEIVRDRVAAIPRRRIPRIERVRRAPDVVSPFDRADAGIGGGVGFGSGTKPGRARIVRKAIGGKTVSTPEHIEVGKAPAEEVSKILRVDAKEAKRFKPIEKVLRARVQTYASFWDPKHGYFKLEIERLGDEALPVIPKDILLVQDCSASMTEQKLYFCRNGLTNCLTRIGPKDRFNVVGFRDRSQFCFGDWVENRPETIEKARNFVFGMRSTGNTDIFRSIQELAKVRRQPGRPVIAILVTDGRSTTGLTRSSDIIGEFSKLNEGKISVYTMGTIRTANSYLLDLLSYGNRGESSVVTRGRWDIPESMGRLMEGVRRPVLSDVRFIFSEGSQCDVYPEQTTNLYMDRPLILYGRYPKSASKVVFQAVGQAADVKCDMVFDLSLGRETRSRDKDIRTGWAEQRLYVLISQYTRTRDMAILKEIQKTAKAYKVKVPYAGKF